MACKAPVQRILEAVVVPLDGIGVAEEITAGVGAGGRVVNRRGLDGEEPP